MSTKQILGVLLLIIAIGAIATFIILKPKSPVTDNTDSEVLPTTAPVSTSAASLLTWTDEAGFSFQYPEGTTINKHPEDSKNYSNLTLTLPSSQTVDVVMSDNTSKEALVSNATLGGKPANKVVKGGQTTITCVDNDVVVIITGSDVSTIADSWQFIYPTPTISKTTKTVAPATSADSGDVLEEE